MKQYLNQATNWITTEKKFTKGDDLVIWLLILGQFFR